MTNEKEYRKEKKKKWEKNQDEKQEENPALITVMAYTHTHIHTKKHSQMASQQQCCSMNFFLFFFYFIHKLFINKHWIECTYWMIIHSGTHSKSYISRAHNISAYNNINVHRYSSCCVHCTVHVKMRTKDDEQH